MTCLITRIKFLFRKKGELYASLKQILGFPPRNIAHYKQALTHRSASRRDAKGHKSNNERLEFLGDAVIETIISHKLYHLYPNSDEGFLSTMRSKLVERKNLGRLAKEIGLIKLLRTDLKFNCYASHNSYLGGNAFEALVGAIYLDRGFRWSQKFIDRLIEQGHINFDKTARVEENFKSLLLEWGQKYKADVKFVMLRQQSSASNGHKPFCCAVMVEGRQVALGTGYNKKECHQAAAKKALQAFRRNPNFERSLLQMKLLHKVVEDLLPSVMPKHIIPSQQQADSAE